MWVENIFEAEGVAMSEIAPIMTNLSPYAFRSQQRIQPSENEVRDLERLIGVALPEFIAHSS
jgi:hypothetical protein